MLERLRLDLIRYGHSGDASLRGTLSAISLALSSPGLIAIAIFRLQEWCMRREKRRSARFLRTINVMLTGADFVPGAEIGPGLLIHHPNGIVVGAGAKVGSHCTILQQVTIGEVLSSRNAGHYPMIGSNVTLGAGARVVGRVTIGDNSIVGANSVVLSDVPANSTAVGAPAKIAGHRSN